MIAPRGQHAAVKYDIDPEYIRKRTGTRHVTGPVLARACAAAIRGPYMVMVAFVQLCALEGV